MKKILFIILIFISASTLGQTISRSILRATQHLATDTIKSISGNGINVWNNKIKLVADPTDPQDAVNLRSLIPYVKKSDSLSVFVTPTQLKDSLADVPQINEDSLVHIDRTEIIIGSKTFNRTVSGSLDTPTLNVINPYNSTGISCALKGSVQGTNASSVALLGVGQNNTVGVQGQSTSGFAIYGTSSTGAGVYGKSISSYGVQAFSNNGIPLYAINVSSSGTANSVQTLLRFDRSTSGTAANGLGGRIEFATKTTDGFGYTSGYIVNKWTNATSGSETSAFEWWLRNNGVAIEKKMDLQGNGDLNVVGNVSLGAVLKLTPQADPPSIHLCDLIHKYFLFVDHIILHLHIFLY